MTIIEKLQTLSTEDFIKNIGLRSSCPIDCFKNCKPEWCKMRWETGKRCTGCIEAYLDSEAK